MSRIGYYGGSFNPPHVGHQATVLYALETARISRLYVAPVYQHPYNKVLAPFSDRIAMCNYMIEPFDGSASVSYVEERAVKAGGSGFTHEAMKVFRREYLHNDDVIVLILGDDIRLDIESWYGYNDLKAEADAGRLEFFFVDRAGDISSTKVRGFLAEGKAVNRLVPASVCEYLDDHPHLYPRH